MEADEVDAGPAMAPAEEGAAPPEGAVEQAAAAAAAAATVAEAQVEAKEAAEEVDARPATAFAEDAVPPREEAEQVAVAAAAAVEEEEKVEGKAVDEPPKSQSERRAGPAAGKGGMNDLSKWLEAVDAEDEDDEDDEMLEKLEAEELALQNTELPAESWQETEQAKLLAASRRTLQESAEGGVRVSDFEERVKDLKVAIGSVSKATAAQKVQKLRAKRQADRQRIRKEFDKHVQDIAERERSARARVLREMDVRRHAMERAKRSLSEWVDTVGPRMRREFNRHEEKLRTAARELDVEIKDTLGTLELNGHYKPRSMLLSQHDRKPQGVRMLIRSINGAKDKLQRGRYSFVTYILDELGGVPVRYSKMKHKPDISVPFFHSGKHNAAVIPVCRTLQAVCPPRRRARLPNVHILELYQHGMGSRRGQERFAAVVGWAVLPMLNAEGGLVEGHFRLPLLRGPYRASFDRYFKIERAVSSNLDGWLGNIYVSVEALPVDAPAPIKVTADFASQAGGHLVSRPTERPPGLGSPEGKTPEESADKVRAGGALQHALRCFRRSRKVASVSLDSPEATKKESAVAEPSKAHDEQLTTNSDGKAALEKAEEEATSSAFEEVDVSNFEYAVERNPASLRGSSFTYLHYMWDDMSNTFAMGRRNANDPWLTLLLFVCAFWIRMVTHFWGQHLYLSGRVPVFHFELLPHRCVLKFPLSSVPLHHQVNVILVGTYLCVAAFACLALASLIVQKLFRFMPSAVSKFVSMFGLLTVLDPLLVLVVDLASLNFDCESACGPDFFSRACWCSESDATRLIRYFQVREGSAINAIYLLLVLYMLLLVTSSTLYCVYLIYVHRDGRAHDLHRRLNGMDASFFIPDDTEVSPQYVALARHRAKGWQGARGASREVDIDHSDAAESVMTIYEVRPGGPRVPWRIFRMSKTSGLIVEVHAGPGPKTAQI